MKEEKPLKSKIAEREEEILRFWKENKIFEKSLEKKSPKGEFVFYDGPPFATGLPHYGSLLSSIVKDVIPRYKTMRGFSVRRRWGWDCHGLPIESLVEKKLGLKTKKDIEKLGVAKFNQEAKEAVLQYASDWERYIERIGRWVEFKNAYKTMDNDYIESVWWALSVIHEKGMLYEGRKVLMYCPHCETPLAKAEIAMDNSYKEITEEAVTVKFKIVGEKNTHFLAWTTTPWTLPGNVALAVGKDIDYVEIINDKDNLILAKKRLDIFGSEYKIIKEFRGQSLIGLEYEPLFDIPKIKEADKDNKAYKVYAADFVNTDEGTGIVHTAVMYGEDDFNLGQRVGLPMVPLLDAGGKFNENAPEFLQDTYIKKAEDKIKSDLEKRGLLFNRKNNTHSYPHCYRCGTALIYNAVSSWFINIQKIKPRLLKLNEKIKWIPEHLKHGRFQNIVENAPDWTISRNRYWASPLPIWKNKEKNEIKVVGSLDELKKLTKKSGNKYFGIRHGESEHNVLNICSSDPKNPHYLTEKGMKEVEKMAQEIKKNKITKIISSPYIRTKQTAEIIADTIGIPRGAIIYDDRLVEHNFGIFNLKPMQEYLKWKHENLFVEAKVPEGESIPETKKRFAEFLYDIEGRFSNENIAIVSHGISFELFPHIILGRSNKEAWENWVKEDPVACGDFVEYEFTSLPHNENYELDLHRPYIDEVELVDGNGSLLKRVPEVVDCWVESGSMPFAEWHYPMENKEKFKSRLPADFIAEYIAQTRTWFYYTHTLSVALFDKISFKNVVTTGTILAADGSKMSKSKGNYTDPLANVDRFSADTLRFYLMGSVVMEAEDINFKDEELREAQNRVVNILWNCFSFFEMYSEGKSQITPARRQGGNRKSQANVLDQWIVSRLNQTIEEVTKYLENYNTVKTCRTIRHFTDDFSTWYIRRSRERFKSDDTANKQEAVSTSKSVLLEFSKLIAPIMPFLAEHIYLGLREEKDPESVHLCDWPKVGEIEIDVLKNMEKTRRIVSLALEKRNEAGIKVRQPLSELRVKNYELRNKEEYLELIKDEINVRRIIFDHKLGEEVELDTEITEELKKEGNIRELIRFVQELRKGKRLTPLNLAELLVETDSTGEKFINSIAEQIKKATNLSGIIFAENNGVETRLNDTVGQVDGMKFKLELK